MIHPACNTPTLVVESRPVLGGANAGMRRRRRYCHACGLTFATYQKPEGDERIVPNTDNEAAVALVMRDKADAATPAPRPREYVALSRLREGVADLPLHSHQKRIVREWLDRAAGANHV